MHADLGVTDVEANPDSKKFVFPERAVETQASSEASGSGSGLYGKDGKLKNPQKSLYYDPIFNPFGAPPPGMPYREKRESRGDTRCNQTCT